MNEYSFMNEGTLTRRIVDLFQSEKKGTTLSMRGIASRVESEDLGRRFLDLEKFTLDALRIAVTGLSNWNVLYTPFTVQEAYVINDKDLWRTDEQYRVYQKLIEESSFMKAGTLTRLVVDLFQPKGKGITLSVGSIAKELGIKIPRRGVLVSEGGFTFEKLEKAVAELCGQKNVLYTRLALPGVYAIKCEHLWRNDEQYRRERDSRLSRIFS